MNELPPFFQKFRTDYPQVHQAYEELARKCHEAGPLEEKTRQLVKIAAAVAMGSEGAVHSHVRQALAAGAIPEEVRHVILLTTPTIGFPNMMAALSWANDILEKG